MRGMRLGLGLSGGAGGAGGGGTFTFDADIVNWWDAREGVTLSGSDVTLWTDKIGAVALTPVNVSARPVYNATGMGGAASIDVGAADEGMTAPFSQTDATWTFIWVGNLINAGAASGRLLSVANGTTDDWNQSGGFAFIRSGSTANPQVYRAGSATSTATGGYGTNRVFMVELNGTQTVLYWNNTLAGSLASGAALATASLGVFRKIGGAAEDGRGQIGDLIIVNRALTAGEKTEVQTFMATRYAL